MLGEREVAEPRMQGQAVEGPPGADEGVNLPSGHQAPSC